MKIEMNETLCKRGRKHVDAVRYLSLDHIVNIAFAEWLQKKEKQDEKEEREKRFREARSGAKCTVNENENNDPKSETEEV